MRPTTKAAFAGSNEGGGKGRGLFGGAVATRGASGGSKGSGARRGGRLGSLLAVLALAAVAAAFTAAPASAAPPVVSVGAVSEASYASAHFTGTVDPAGAEVFFHFQYSTDGVNWNFTGYEGPVSTETPGPQPVQADLGGFKGGTKYFVRLAAIGTTEGAETISPEPNSSFETLPVEPPTVLAANDATEVSFTTAKVSGKVERPANPVAPPFDPNSAFNAHCRFEYVNDVQFNETGFAGATTVPCNVDPVETPEAKEPVEAEISGLSVSTTYHVRLAAENAGGTDTLEAPDTFTTLFAAPPTVSLSSIDPGANKADLISQVNPQGHPTSAYFEYSSDGGVNWASFPEPVELGEGSSPVDFDRTLTGLEPNTEYLVRLHASNLAGESVTDPPQSFKTDAVAPIVQTLSAGAGTDAATLAGRVNPQNSPVTYQFEWGTTAAYGNFAPAPAEPLGSADNAFHVVTTPIAGLSPATVYHFRIVATNTQTSEKEVGQDRTFTTLPAAEPPATCPNEASRVGPSTGLPDCRAYELATPGLNGSLIAISGGGKASADGSAISFVLFDAPNRADGSFVSARAIARRGSAGWTTDSLSPPTPFQSVAYITSTLVRAISSDYSQSVVLSDQPLAGPGSPAGSNLYLHGADGSFTALTRVGLPSITDTNVTATSRDFTHIFFTPRVKQFDEDPTVALNAYEWTDGELRLVGILPGEGHVPAPDGASLVPGVLPAISDDGEQVLFSEGLPQDNGQLPTSTGPLYLRQNGAQTIIVSTSQRLQDPDPNPPAPAHSVGITAAGSTVLFTSRSELTENANTGETNGTANDAGDDLYSYDVQGKKLTDLTVDSNPADAATGANVQAVAGTTEDASYVYFVATGDLAPGAISGEENLYVEHNGAVAFIAPAGGLVSSDNNGILSVRSFYVTPDGRHAAFASPLSLTGYDNTNPSSGRNEYEVFKYSYGGGLECASCRPSGAPPVEAASISGRALSDDGTRLFFQSTDAVLPQASNGRANVYEYEGGEVHLLTPGDGADVSVLLDASASGADVFIATHDELAPGAQGGAASIYDVRVNADVVQPNPSRCSGEDCLGVATEPPGPLSPGSARFETRGGIVGPSSKAGRGSKLHLRLTAPEGGSLTISGVGLKSAHKQVKKPGSVTIAVALNSGASRSLLKKGAFNTKARVLFKSSSGDTSRDEVALHFQAPAKKGGK